MKEYEKPVEEFACFLASTPTYTNYVKVKAKIDAQPELAFKIKEFKRAQVDYELKRMQNIPSAFEEEKYLSKLYSDLQLVEEAREFLAGERNMLAMLELVNERIIAACPVEIEI